jgi:hypothetical protein
MSGPIVLYVSLALMSAWADEMKAGEAAHASMDLEGALKRFERALELTTSVEEKVRTRMWLGVVRCELGEFKECESEFLEALELDENVKLVVDVPPKTRGIFEGAKLKRAPPPLPPDPTAPEPVPEIEPESVEEPAPVEIADEQESNPRRINWLLIGGGAVMLSSLIVGTTAFFLDAGAGPQLLDGGPASNAAYGAGAVLFVAGGAVTVASLFVE